MVECEELMKVIVHRADPLGRGAHAGKAKLNWVTCEKASDGGGAGVGVPRLVGLGIRGTGKVGSTAIVGHHERQAGADRFRYYEPEGFEAASMYECVRTRQAAGEFLAICDGAGNMSALH